ncbi:MAG: protein nirD [gamma proteobacterium symbiont of Stewartia floridana]|nr:MAG: protein nirD [gamma proteobacterium symbiont of Stewartia floridana]RLW68141.1 MAG: protein nirD [gamma proteobacterium symbiont of Stewartia floridana]
MAEVNCLYCGKKIADDRAECPHCGAVSHYQKRGFRSGARNKFIIFFIGLVIFCGFFIFWLPR